MVQAILFVRGIKRWCHARDGSKFNIHRSRSIPSHAEHDLTRIDTVRVDVWCTDLPPTFSSTGAPKPSEHGRPDHIPVLLPATLFARFHSLFRDLQETRGERAETYLIELLSSATPSKQTRACFLTHASTSLACCGVYVLCPHRSFLPMRPGPCDGEILAS